MPYYRSVGSVPRTRHTQHRRPDGGLYYEELVGEEGFSSDSSLLYHQGIPSAMTAARPWAVPDQSTRPNDPLLPRHLRPTAGEPAGDVVTGRRLLLGNPDVRISYAAGPEASPLYRNATGDECVFVQEGRARLESTLGALEVGPGDFVVVPRSLVHRWVPAPGEVLRALCIEAAGHVAPPSRYLSRHGQLLEQAPYCERDLRGPDTPLLAEGEDVEVYVKHRAGGTVHVMARHPFDVVGWDGCVYPFALDVRDFQPITGRVHQPPPVHQVFEGPSFVLCAFVPRKVDYHPLAVPVPYYHSNVDSDEVMFYVAGDYTARRGSGVATGSVTLHPGGHTHGPQPGAVERSLGATEFDELAVMVDTFRPLELGEAAWACEDPGYPWTWARRGT